MEEEISLIEVFDILKKRLGMIVSLGIIGLIVTSVFTFFIATPQYSSTTKFLVNRQQTGDIIQQSDINTNLQLINTYREIIKEPVILDEVRENLNLGISHKELSDKIKIENQENSQLFSLTVTDDNPFDAAAIANAVAVTFQENIEDIMDVDNVAIISEANTNTNPVSPNATLNLAIGLLLGLMIGTGLAFLYEFLDNTVKDEKFITEEVGWTYLGRVSEMNHEELKPSEATLLKQLENAELIGNRSSRV